uniref:Retrovirus-related Pol polyprotein from transposon TNT 1-94 n=1 Tax=Tanacetum cinerariifolium TaxID=118510 RepID=A0A699J4D0_TANCI|nr:retrovirus-related Pol polyprotein from transposon TNT 1-94 [Tanacetum cinerariifolium]
MLTNEVEQFENVEVTLENQLEELVEGNQRWRLKKGDRKDRRMQPKHSSDYEVKLPPSIDHTQPASNQESSTVHPLSHYVSYEHFSNTHKAFLSSINNHDEPKSFSQAAQNKNWKEAMKKEIHALEQNGTWTLENLPKGKKAIDSKWVYKIKFKPSGEVERYKARLVAKGFTQIEGVDYHETFAPVAKLVKVRTLLAISMKRGWEIRQLDVDNAFLHGDLEEEVYMKIPQGFSKENETRVCKLKKSIYGLKQASRNWYHKFTKSLMNLGYKQSRADHSLFIYKDADVYVAALIYVDDVILVGNNMKQIARTKSHLDKIETQDAITWRLQTVLRYLKTTAGQGILLPKTGGINLVAYCDSDWLGCPLSRRSRTEYRAMATSVSEIIWDRWLLEGLDAAMVGPTPLLCDNQAAKHIANNPVFYERAKHVEMDCYFVRERVELTFFPDFFVLQGLKTGNLIGAGDCRGGLYWMEGIKEERHAMMVTIDS